MVSSSRLHDQMGNADLTRVSTAAFGMIDSLQRNEALTPGEAVAAVSAVFILAMEASRLPVADAVGTTRNLMADAHGRRGEFKAITDYLKAEVLKKQ